MKDNKLVLWFDELELADIPQVGGKNASLGEMRRELSPKGVSIPDGYAVTAYAYRYLLKSAGIIDDYFILAPGDYAAAMYAGAGDSRLRQEILRTAERFLGVPYRWGGESTTEGFDCSGLTMVVYRLNGLELPRTSADQWRAGRPVDRDEMDRGDLVFFATRGGSRISHVGIYLGGDLFLHAPRRGTVIQTDSLASDYYRSRYVGARSYL